MEKNMEKLMKNPMKTPQGKSVKSTARKRGHATGLLWEGLRDIGHLVEPRETPQLGGRGLEGLQWAGNIPLEIVEHSGAIVSEWDYHSGCIGL